MRLPSFVPALLLMLSVACTATDVVLARDAAVTMDRPITAEYHDDNVTFRSVEVWWAEPGDILRTPGWRPETDVRITIIERDGNSTFAASWTRGQDMSDQVEVHTSRALIESGLLEVMLIPGGCHIDLVHGRTPVTYW